MVGWGAPDQRSSSRGRLRVTVTSPSGAGAPPSLYSHASPPSSSFTSFGANARNSGSSQRSHRSGGSTMWESLEMRGAIASILGSICPPARVNDRSLGPPGLPDRAPFREGVRPRRGPEEGVSARTGRRPLLSDPCGGVGEGRQAAESPRGVPLVADGSGRPPLVLVWAATRTRAHRDPGLDGLDRRRHPDGRPDHAGTGALVAEGLLVAAPRPLRAARARTPPRLGGDRAGGAPPDRRSSTATCRPGSDAAAAGRRSG